MASPFTAVDLLVDIFFLLDMAKNARTAYYDYNGDVVDEPRKPDGALERTILRPAPRPAWWRGHQN